MQIIINSKNQVDVNEISIQQWQTDISDSLERFSDWITRVEVHLSDENSQAKSGLQDIRCLMEARPANHQPVSIEVRAASVEQAVSEGTSTLQRRLGTMIDKLRTANRKPG